MYVLSRQISLSIDRGLSNWTELRDFLCRIRNNEGIIDVIKQKRGERILLFSCGNLVSRSSLSLLKNSLNYLNYHLESGKEINKAELIQLRLDIANISSYLEGKLPKRFKNVPVEHFNQSIRCITLPIVKTKISKK